VARCCPPPLTPAIRKCCVHIPSHNMRKMGAGIIIMNHMHGLPTFQATVPTLISYNGPTSTTCAPPQIVLLKHPNICKNYSVTPCIAPFLLVWPDSTLTTSPISTHTHARTPTDMYITPPFLTDAQSTSETSVYYQNTHNHTPDDHLHSISGINSNFCQLTHTC
jgi:hypothetical protein